MNWSNLYKSTFSILRIENNQARVAGTGFVINTNPIYVATCYHVVSEGTEENNGNIKYSITRRSRGEQLLKFDLRKAQISYLRASKIFSKPEFDLAILKIEPETSKEVAKNLNLAEIKALTCSFKDREQEIGTPVQWLNAGVLQDITLTPRFFKGDILTRYTTDHKYKFKSQNGSESEQLMSGIQMIEIDQLFIPGSSGGAVLNRKGKVIGYVHGFRSWPIITGTVIEHNVQITDGAGDHKAKIKQQVPLVTSLSLAINIQSAQEYLRSEGFIKEGIVEKLMGRFY